MSRDVLNRDKNGKFEVRGKKTAGIVNINSCCSFNVYLRTLDIKATDRWQIKATRIALNEKFSWLKVNQ
jgi:hypothetical protein